MRLREPRYDNAIDWMAEAWIAAVDEIMSQSGDFDFSYQERMEMREAQELMRELEPEQMARGMRQLVDLVERMGVGT